MARSSQLDRVLASVLRAAHVPLHMIWKQVQPRVEKSTDIIALDPVWFIGLLYKSRISGAKEPNMRDYWRLKYCLSLKNDVPLEKLFGTFNLHETYYSTYFQSPPLGCMHIRGNIVLCALISCNQTSKD